jgi:hypothetical protein
MIGRIARRRSALGLLLGICAAMAAFTAVPAQGALSDADKKTLAEMALQWAIDGGIGDFKLVKNPINLIVANFNLPKDVKLEVPGRTINLFSLLRIQAEANHGGDFLYFRFNRLEGEAEQAKVAIALVWAVGEQSSTQYLSGGGATLDFEKRDGKWQLQPVMNRWGS